MRLLPGKKQATQSLFEESRASQLTLLMRCLQCSASKNLSKEKTSTAYLPGLDQYATYTIASDKNTDGKRRISWQVDHLVEQLDGAMSNSLAQVDTDVPQAKEEDVLAVPNIISHDAGLSLEISQVPADRGVTFDVPHSLALDNNLELNMGIDELGTVTQQFRSAVYQHMERIEYWSQTNKRWLAGRIRVKSNPEGYLEAHSYSVQLCFGQLRDNVGLDLLRAPLQAGEAVGVYIEHSRWVSGTIKASQPAFPTFTGYRVITDDGTTFENVSANFLRRSYPAESIVEVYRGPSVGWVAARTLVQDDATADALNDSEAAGEQSVQPSMTMVRVILNDSNIAGEVPSYLVRRQSGAKSRTRVWL